MKTTTMKTMLILIAAAAALVLSSCGRTTENHDHRSDSTQASIAADYYTCVMHPQVHSDKPGSCPICGMTLVKASTVSASAGSGSPAASAVTLNERGQSLADVATTIASMQSVEYVVRAFGTLEIPEPNKTMISARFSGRIEKLHVASIGAPVRKGQALFDIYSPDIVQAQNDYAQAYKHAGVSSPETDLMPSGPQSTPASVNAHPDQAGGASPTTLLSAMRSKLQLLGFTNEQIRHLESAGTAPLVYTYYSPASGIVVDKKIVDGMYISEGQPLFEISDLSTLWDVADVSEADASRIRTGDKAVIVTQNGEEHRVPATVAFIYPVVNPQSRTVKIRLTVNNAAGGLKPNMYTQAIFTQRSDRALTVPVTAVLITGKRNIVYVKTNASGQFEGRDVTLGTKYDGKYEITSGLREGDTVVTQGGYLIDSESQLRSGALQ
jgi:membrane fusion protein, copper/silver efflux system